MQTYQEGNKEHKKKWGEPGVPSRAVPGARCAGLQNNSNSESRHDAFKKETKMQSVKKIKCLGNEWYQQPGEENMCFLLRQREDKLKFQ